ncbi:cysteine desulfurase [Alicyclobacillus tolerans]|uniref:cysteine desulfurase family protein n=1 Tax=Alicyclobacillus tolerans TaxID=90970 RepID=UPI001F293EAC|nr:cysteine desulfurase family protein [Alicyclobacillus tolerans]MCF8563289.1 cysteine desulfurase [Alicyclobacillus tolerans]
MIYLDNAATTPVSQPVLDRMQPFLYEEYGNPSSIHQAGRRARKVVEGARRQVAQWLGCQSKEVVFTSGGTESDHSALFGAYLASQGRSHLVVSAVEHHAVLHTAEFLQQLGVRVTMVQPDRFGWVSPQSVVEALQPDTFAVSVMTVNNELGTIEPVAAIAQAVKQADAQVMVHSDMVQTAGACLPQLGGLQVDLASFSAHKLNGPKGIGALFVRESARWKPVVYGGNQERQRRAGTENVAAIAGFGEAAEDLTQHFEQHLAHLEKVKQAFLAEVQSAPGCRVNSPVSAAPSILNVSFDGVKNDVLLIRLDLAGVLASAGSACTAGSLEPSHVLKACGYDDKRLSEAIRFSFGIQNTVEEAQQAGRITADAVRALRNRANGESAK